MSNQDQAPGNKQQNEPIPGNQQDPNKPTPGNATGVSANPAAGGRPSVNTARPLVINAADKKVDDESSDVVNDTQMPQTDESVSSVETTPTGTMGSTATGQGVPALPEARAVEEQSNQLAADLVASGAVPSSSFPTETDKENASDKTTSDETTQNEDPDQASPGGSVQQVGSDEESQSGSQEAGAGQGVQEPNNQPEGAQSDSTEEAQDGNNASGSGQRGENIHPDENQTSPAESGTDVGQPTGVQGSDGQGNSDGQSAQSAAQDSTSTNRQQVTTDTSAGTYSGVAVHGEDPVAVAAANGTTTPQPPQESPNVQSPDSGSSASSQSVPGNNSNSNDVSNATDSGSAPTGQLGATDQGDQRTGGQGGSDNAAGSVQSGTGGQDVGAVGGATSTLSSPTGSANAEQRTNDGLGSDQISQQAGTDVAAVDAAPQTSDAAGLINSTSGSTDMNSTANNPKVPVDKPADSGSSAHPPAVTTNPTPDPVVSPASPDVAATTDSNAPPNTPTPPVAKTTDPASPAPVAATDDVTESVQTPSEPQTSTMNPNPADTSNDAPGNVATGTSDASTAAPSPAPAQVIDTSGTAAAPAPAPVQTVAPTPAPAPAPAATPEASSGPTGIANVDRILDGIPASMLTPILAIKNYMTNMAPRKPTDPKTGAEHQVTLFRAMQQIINNESEHFEKLFTAMLRMFEHGGEQAFSETHVFRFMEHVKLNSDEIRGFQKLVNLIKVLGPVEGRKEAARQVDVPQSVTHGVTESGRNRILSYFGY